MKNDTQIQKVETTAPAFNIETLINRAVEQNLSVEALERLLALRKTLKDEWAKEEYYKALAAFQRQCPIVEKKKKVSFSTTNYSYAPLEDIVEQVKEPLAQNGFSYMFDTVTNGKMKVICKTYHKAGHSETATFDMEIDANAKMNISQKYGSALTYAKRYAFCAAFAINVKNEDSDARTVDNSAESSRADVAENVESRTPRSVSSDTCESCHAPAGKPHASKCPNK